MKQEISDGHGVMDVIYKLYVYRGKQGRRETRSPPMDGGAGKCGQNAGDVMEREIFRSSRRRLTARARFGAPPFARDDRLDGGGHVGGMLSLTLGLGLGVPLCSPFDRLECAR
jgi:hypothetical protein